MDSAVTIVLPVHNAERALRPLITRILDLASGPAGRLVVAIVDDGSTDETFEAACELARDFPQVRVFRQPFQLGLGPALEEVRRRLGVDEAIVHDGVGPIDLDELAALLGATATPSAAGRESALAEGRGSRRFAAVTALNTRLAEAHRAISSFHWLRLEEPARPRRRSVAPSLASHTAGAMAPLAHLGTSSFAGEFPIPLS